MIGTAFLERQKLKSRGITGCFNMLMTKYLQLGIGQASERKSIVPRQLAEVMSKKAELHLKYSSNPSSENSVRFSTYRNRFRQIPTKRSRFLCC